MPPAAAAWADEFSTQQRRQRAGQGPAVWGDEFASFQSQQHPAATGEKWAEDFSGAQEGVQRRSLAVASARLHDHVLSLPHFCVCHALVDRLPCAASTRKAALHHPATTAAATAGRCRGWSRLGRPVCRRRGGRRRMGEGVCRWARQHRWASGCAWQAHWRLFTLLQEPGFVQNTVSWLTGAEAHAASCPLPGVADVASWEDEYMAELERLHGTAGARTAGRGRRTAAPLCLCNCLVPAPAPSPLLPAWRRRPACSPAPALPGPWRAPPQPARCSRAAALAPQALAPPASMCLPRSTPSCWTPTA